MEENVPPDGTRASARNRPGGGEEKGERSSTWTRGSNSPANHLGCFLKGVLHTHNLPPSPASCQGGHDDWPHFPDKKTEAQKDETLIQGHKVEKLRSQLRVLLFS